MRIILVDDEYCCRLNEEYYVSDYGKVLINRYLLVFDRVNVAFRTKIVQNNQELGKYRNKVTDARITMFYIPFFQGPKQYAKVYFEVKKAVKKVVKGCDLAILRLPSTIGFDIWQICKRRHIPYATEIVFSCFDVFANSKLTFRNFLWWRLHTKQVKACNSAIGVACVTAKYLQQHYFPLDISAPTSHYSSIEMPSDFLYKARLFPDRKIFQIVHVAIQVQFASRKGHNELIEALSIVRKNGINASITFVGEDYDNGISLLTDLAKSYHVEDFINFTGFVSKAKLREILIDSDLAVLPTRAEGLPRVIIEAMAMGLPCITTPVSGNAELIDNRYLVEFSDVERQAQCIIDLLSDSQLYQEVSKTNFERSKEYTAEVLNKRRCSFYTELKNIVLKSNNN